MADEAVRIGIAVDYSEVDGIGAPAAACSA